MKSLTTSASARGVLVLAGGAAAALLLSAGSASAASGGSSQPHHEHVAKGHEHAHRLHEGLGGHLGLRGDLHRVGHRHSRHLMHPLTRHTGTMSQTPMHLHARGDQR